MKYWGKYWGAKEFKMPSSHIFVKYLQNYKSRAVINFKTGLILIETLNKSKNLKNLVNAVTTTILTPSDPRSVDLYTAKTNHKGGKPYFFGLIHDENKKHIKSKNAAAQYASFLVKNKIRNRSTKMNGVRSKIYFIKIKMVYNHQNIRARRYAKVINKYADSYRINRNLVYAVIQTESNFNPYSISSAPAYGLMQIVPRTGGRDAYKKVHGTDKIPTKEYLLNYKNNIEMGTAYINVLYYKYFSKVRNLSSREYCVIAAYNTGLGNVFTAFSKKQHDAIRKINQLNSTQVYQYLRKKLRYKEARDYIYKVSKARPRYKNF